MKLLISTIIAFSLVGAPVFAVEKGFAGRPITNNLFAPTGYTLHKGEFALGIGPVAFGISENIQAETNLLLCMFQVYNAGLKISFSKSEQGAVAAGVGIMSLSLGSGDDNVDEVSFLGGGPFVALSHRMSPTTMIHVGGRYTHFSDESDDNDIDDVEADASSSGTSIFGGIEYSMSEQTKFVADGGYDFDFEGVRFGGGVMFGLTMFRLKLGVSYFSAGDGFVFPHIGLWWRFQG